eukprot:TRINITY_DN10009_c0_g1_i2.p1 TRINITY_DN10009_c0_g1~~TRINITY_DN10009_c0_g1_i2.p1  ORF type:complete len:761 (+),score=178.19 TRINITY_DN10009_c0_g1_i2:15-2297(+)
MVGQLLLLFVATTASLELYQNPNQDVLTRANDLLAKMTIEEKIVQTFSPYGSPSIYPDLIEKYGQYGLGALVAHDVDSRNQIQAEFMNASRLKIPVTFHHESLHGGASGAAVFPMPLTQGNTWNTSLVTLIAQRVAYATRAYGANIGFAPVINLFTDPRYGRHQEGFSPNPTLTAHYARASVLGLQGSITGNATTYLPKNSIAALGKHFAAYGAAMGGLNAAPAVMGERQLRQIYLKPWRAFGKAGGRGAMPSHNTVLDVPCHANDWLVNKVFREEFGFGEGLTISDCNDLNVLMNFGIAANVSQAAAKGLIGGVDMDLQCGDTTTYGIDSIKDALASGLMSEAALDNAARHALVNKFAAGLFESPMTPTPVPDCDTAYDRQLAREAAQQGTVLAINDGTLPLSADANEKVVVIGPLGGPGSEKDLLGSYTSYSSRVEVVTIQEGLSNAGIEAGFVKGVDTDDGNLSGIPAAVAACQQADVVVLALGDSLASCGEWSDRASLDLPGGQLALLYNITQACSHKKIITVLINGHPTTFGYLNQGLNNVNSLLISGRPGEEAGNALADLIYGKVAPSGKLSTSWPRTVDHVGSGSSPWLQSIRGKWSSNTRGPPDARDGRIYDPYSEDPYEATPLFEFGHGLTYTSFAYSNLVAKPSHNDSAPIQLAFEILNKGRMTATEVYQVYIQDPIGTSSNVVSYWKRVAAFGRVTIAPGQTAQVATVIEYDDIAVYDDNMQYTLKHGTYILTLGESSRQDTVKATVTL